MQKRENSIKVEDKVERQATVEKNPEEIEEEANMATMNVLKHYLEKPNNDNDIKINNKLEEQGRNKEQPIALSNPKVEKTGKFLNFLKYRMSVNSDFDIC